METSPSENNVETEEPEEPESARKFQSAIQRYAYTATPTGKSAAGNVRAIMSADTTSHRLRTLKPPITPSTPGRVKDNAAGSASKIHKSSISTSRSRKVEVEDLEVEERHSPKKIKRGTAAKERSANDQDDIPNKLVDMIRPGLILVMIGLNPGRDTAKTGLAYFHHSNLFYKLLFWSGLTPILHKPTIYPSLMDLYSIGNTNICARPSQKGSDLTVEEMIQGQLILETKIATFRPEAVCIVGKGIWDVIYKAKTGKALKQKDFQWGWQDESLWLGREVNGSQVVWPGSRTFVTTSTSGLAAHLKPDEKRAIWKPLGEWFLERRAQLEKL